MSKYTFTRVLRSKGWTMRELAERWGYHMHSIGRMASRPSQRDMDAVAGLPDKVYDDAKKSQ